MSFKIKRGDKDIPLEDGELYLNKSKNCLQFGNNGIVSDIVATNTKVTGDLTIDGHFYANTITGKLIGNALTADKAEYAKVAEYALTTKGVMEKAETANYAEVAKTAPDYTRLEDFNTFKSEFNTGSFSGEFLGTATNSTHAEYSTLAELANDVVTKKYLTTGSVNETQSIDGTLNIKGRLITNTNISSTNTVIKDNTISLTAYEGDMGIVGIKVLLDDTEVSAITYDTKTNKWNTDKTFVGNFEGTITNAITSSYPIELRGDTLYCNLANNVFFGKNVAELVEDINNSIFLGSNTGRFSKKADNCVFIGYEAGDSTIDADNSVLIGYRVGKNYNDNSIGNNNIIIGTNITLAPGTNNAINLGGVIFATGTQSNTIDVPSYMESKDGKVGICNPNPTHTLDVNGSVNVSEFLKLQPIVDLPQTAEIGTIVSMGAGDNFKMYVYNGSAWKTITLI